jgi:molecular chaperone GrpE
MNENETSESHEPTQVQKCEFNCNCCQELPSANKRAEENLNMAKYQKAEFENYKKRCAAQADHAFAEGKSFVLVNILPVLDSLVEALKIVSGSENRSGLEILYRKFESILTSVGLEEVQSSAGTKFDPRIHNAVIMEKAEGKPAGYILEEWQKGYKMGDRLIRPATVKVSE